MNRDYALKKLPESYRLALNLRDMGLSHEVIAERLDIEVEAVGPCLEVAEAKLAALLDLTHMPIDQEIDPIS